MKEITQFIVEWKGLKVDPSDVPNNLQEYKTKSQSWMYGRRATQYGRNLYPIMLEKAHQVMITYLLLFR